MAHRESISAYLRELHLENVVVHDWGCGGKPITKYVSFGDNVRYLSFDKNPESQAMKICDIEEDMSLPYEDMSDVAFCMEVLEHTKVPGSVIRNISLNMKIGGTLYLSVPFLFDVHHTEDYWRFTDQGIRLLLESWGFNILQLFPTENRMGWLVKAKKL